MLNTKEYFHSLNAISAVEEISDEIAETSNGGGSLIAPASNPDVILYANGNFGSGDALTIAGDVGDGDENLDNDLFGSGWNNKVSSIKVIRGEWKIFKDDGYNGQSKVLTPGDYTHPAFGIPDNSLTGILRTG